MAKYKHSPLIERRLSVFGFNPVNTTQGDALIIDSLISKYAAAKNKEAGLLLIELSTMAQKYSVVLNATALTNLRNSQKNNKPKQESKKQITHSLCVINPPKQQIKKPSTIYQARGVNIVGEQKESALCTCSKCKRIARNEYELRKYFDTSLNDRRVTMICIDCE